MKTLIINGSPRKTGGTATLINELKKYVQGEITTIDTYYTKTSPCNDCRYCWSNGKCVINDDMQEIYKIINEADNIVIASPIYFAEVTGSLLQWASRLQYIWTSKNFRHEPILEDKVRKGGVILVDGGDGHMETAFAMAKRLLRVMGADYKGLVYFSGTDKMEPMLPQNSEQCMADIRKLADMLNY